MEGAERDWEGLEGTGKGYKGLGGAIRGWEGLEGAGMGEGVRVNDGRRKTLFRGGLVLCGNLWQQRKEGIRGGNTWAIPSLTGLVDLMHMSAPHRLALPVVGLEMGSHHSLGEILCVIPINNDKHSQ